MIFSYRFDTFSPGPHLVIFGAVHGNEKCGTQAIRKFIHNLESGKIALAKGILTCIPICNPKAYDNDTRFYQRNLNRSLYVKDKPQAYEDFIDPILCRVLEEGDVLLDLHSYASKGSAFGFLGNSSQAEIDYCCALGVDDFVYGWADAFGKTGGNPKDAMGTVEYARSVGCIATTIECGHHADTDAPDIAYRTIHHALAHLGMLDNFKPQTDRPKRFVKMQSVFFKQKSGDLAQPWKHYDEVGKGDLLATYADGGEVRASDDGFIVLPKLDAEIGGEWFYFGIQTECPSTQT